VSAPLDQLTAAELLAALDEELARLPERYRAPLVLCCLEGLTRDEAARRLMLPPATLKSQLERGRRLPGAALERRGVTLGAGLLALTAASPAEAASPGLIGSVVAAATGGGWSKRVLRVAAVVVLIGGLCAAPLLSGDKTAKERGPAAAPPAPKPAAADLVRKLREDQAWLTRAKRFEARLEGTRTTYDGKVLPETYEIAFDARRLRHVWAMKGLHEHERVWDGKRATTRYRDAGGEIFSFSAKMEDVGGEMLGGLHWLWMQPHTFWWTTTKSRKQQEIDRSLLGEPGDFVVSGRQVYRGVPCLMLHKKGWELLRYYVGEKTGLLHGLLSGALFGNPEANRLAGEFGAKHGKQLRTFEEFMKWVDDLEPEKGAAIAHGFMARCHPTDKPKHEAWMLDYKEVKPGCWFPMTQGFATYKGPFARPSAESGELRVASVRVDGALAEAMFTAPALREGATVYDNTGDAPFSYKYRKADGPKAREAARAEAARLKEQEAKEKARRDELVGTAAPAFPKAEWVNGGGLTLADLKGKRVLLLFWSSGCAPCDAYKSLLHKATDRSPVVVVGVHDPGATRDQVEKALKAAKADGPVLIDPKDAKDREGGGVVMNHYRLRFLPSAVLIDAAGKVEALGHVDEVMRKLRPADVTDERK
jgi:thiol-disulfide isomerase/thioredoxin